MFLYASKNFVLPLARKFVGEFRLRNHFLTLRLYLLCRGVATEEGEGGYSDPPLLKSGGDVPTRFENEVAQVRCLPIFRVFCR